ncbi:WD40-repeat-containing domain protein [Trichoderma chlorosporum]
MRSLKSFLRKSKKVSAEGTEGGRGPSPSTKSDRAATPLPDVKRVNPPSNNASIGSKSQMEPMQDITQNEGGRATNLLDDDPTKREKPLAKLPIGNTIEDEGKTSTTSPNDYSTRPDNIIAEVENPIVDDGEKSTTSLNDESTKREATAAEAKHTIRDEGGEFTTDSSYDDPAKLEKTITRATESLDEPLSVLSIPLKLGSFEESPKATFSLWDVAYDSLKSEYPDLCRDYERRIGLWLQSNSRKRQQYSKINLQNSNIFSMNYQERQKQMERIVSFYLSVDQNDDNSTDTDANSDIESSKDIETNKRSSDLWPHVRDIMKSSGYLARDPALPWAGGKKSLSHFSHSPTTLLLGINYIVSRIRWYTLLAKLLDNTKGDINDDYDDENNDDGSTEMSVMRETRALQVRITDLYKEVLLYQAHVVCFQTNDHMVKHEAEIDQLLLIKDGGISESGIMNAEKALACLNGQKLQDQLNRLAKYNVDETASKVSDDADTNDVKLQLVKLDAIDPLELISDLSRETLNRLYQWVCQTSQYKDLIDGNSRVLWVSGNPDTGRIMTIWAMIQRLSARKKQELQQNLQQNLHTSFVSFSFCGKGKQEVDTATSVVKTLIYHTLMHQPTLQGHLMNKYESTGRADFSDGNDAYALSLVLYDIIRDENFEDTIFLINGIDEIENGAHFIQELINTTLSLSKGVKWIISTSTHSLEKIYMPTADSIQQGNMPHIDMDGEYEDVQSIFVDSYIPYKMKMLTQKNELYADEFGKNVGDLLRKLCPGKFLWVDIACEAISREDAWHAPHVVERLSQKVSNPATPFDSICEQVRLENPWLAPKPQKRALPNPLPHDNALHKLYSKMLADIAKLPFQDSELCLKILLIMVVVYRPLDLLELEAALDLAPQIDLEVLVKKCFPFLEIRGTTVCFTSQTTKVFILQEINEDPSVLHFWTMQACLRSLEKFWDQSSQKLPKGKRRRSTVSTSYAALYWPRHLCQVNNAEHESKAVTQFFPTNILQWLDLLISSSRLPQALSLISELQSHFNDKIVSGSKNVSSDHRQNLTLIYETQQLLRFHKLSSSPVTTGINNTLLFHPSESKLQEPFMKQRWPHLVASSTLTNFWSPIIHTLRGHTDYVRTCAYSHDGKLLASGSDDGSVRIWNAETGEIQHVVRAFSNYAYVYDISFSSKGYVAATDRNRLKVWNVSTGELQELRGPDNWLSGIASVHFSQDGSMLVAAAGTSIIIWSLPSFNVIMDEKDVLGGEGDECIKFSRDGAFIGAASRHHLDIWKLEGPENNIIAEDEATSGTDDSHLVYVWDWMSGLEPTKFSGHTDSVKVVAFSPCGSFFASGSDDKTCRIWPIPWDAKLPQPVLILRGHTRSVYGISFCTSTKRAATCSSDETVRIWDYTNYEITTLPKAQKAEEIQPHKRSITRIALSGDEKWLASASDDGEICLWDGNQGQFERKLSGHKRGIESLEFSHDSTRLVSGSDDDTIRVWELKGDFESRSLLGHSNWVRCAVLSYDGRFVVSGSNDMTVRVWDLSQPNVGKMESTMSDEETDEGNDQGIRILQAHEDYVMFVLFSHDGKYVVSGADDGEMLLWDISKVQSSSSEPKVVIRERGHGRVNAMTFSADSKLFFASWSDNISIWKIDETDMTFDSSPTALCQFKDC